MIEFLTTPIKNLLSTCLNKLEPYLSEEGAKSLGRLATFILIWYFMIQDAWFFHRFGHLVDNYTLTTQFSVAFSPYFGNKAHNWLVGKQGSADQSKNDPAGKQSPEQGDGSGNG